MKFSANRVVLPTPGVNGFEQAALVDNHIHEPLPPKKRGRIEITVTKRPPIRGGWGELFEGEVEVTSLILLVRLSRRRRREEGPLRPARMKERRKQ